MRPLRAVVLIRIGPVLALLWMFGGLCVSAGAADDVRLLSAGSQASATAASNSAEPLIDIDIPAQPLNTALKRYATLTRQPTLFRSEIVTGLTSSAVHGLYTPAAALRLLLQGSGLEAEHVSEGRISGFILKQADIAAATPRAADPGGLDGYAGGVQFRLWQALCDEARTTPGAYRSLVRFQIDASGQVQRVRLLSSTGSPGRDAAVRATLQRVRLDRPPPDLPQPLTLFIEPHESAGGPECGREVP